MNNSFILNANDSGQLLYQPDENNVPYSGTANSAISESHVRLSSSSSRPNTGVGATTQNYDWDFSNVPFGNITLPSQIPYAPFTQQEQFNVSQKTVEFPHWPAPAQRTQSNWSHVFPQPEYQANSSSNFDQQRPSFAGPSRSRSCWDHTRFDHNAESYPSLPLSWPVNTTYIPSSTSFPQRAHYAVDRSFRPLQRSQSCFVPTTAPGSNGTRQPRPQQSAMPMGYRVIRGPADNVFNVSHPTASANRVGQSCPGSTAAAQMARSPNARTIASQRPTPSPGAAKARRRKLNAVSSPSSNFISRVRPYGTRDPTKPRRCALPRDYKAPLKNSDGADEGGEKADDGENTVRGDLELCNLEFPNSVALMIHVEQYHKVPSKKNTPGMAMCPWDSYKCKKVKNPKPMGMGSLLRHISEVHGDIPRKKKDKGGNLR